MFTKKEKNCFYYIKVSKVFLIYFIDLNSIHFSLAFFSLITTLKSDLFLIFTLCWPKDNFSSFSLRCFPFWLLQERFSIWGRLSNNFVNQCQEWSISQKLVLKWKIQHLSRMLIRFSRTLIPCSLENLFLICMKE